MADATINISIKTDPAQPLQLIIKQSKEAEKAVGGLSESFASVAASVAGAYAAVKAGSAAFSFVLNSTRQMEDLTTQFIAFTGSAEAASDQMERLSAFASESPFELAEVAEADKILLAFGSTAKGSLEQLRQLGEVSAATGKDLSELATIFGQIQAEGKLTGERFGQLIERGINIGPEIAKSLGVASSSIRQLASEGKITADIVAAAFQRMTSEGGQFFGSTDRLSKTVSGSISTLKDNFSILAAEIGGHASPIFNDWVTVLSSATSSLTEYLKAQDQIAGGGESAKRVEEIKDALVELQDQLEKTDNEIKGGFNFFGDDKLELQSKREVILTEYKILNTELIKLTDERNKAIQDKEKKATSDEAASIREKLAEKAFAAEQERNNKLLDETQKAAEARGQAIQAAEKSINETRQKSGEVSILIEQEQNAQRIANAARAAEDATTAEQQAARGRVDLATALRDQANALELEASRAKEDELTAQRIESLQVRQSELLTAEAEGQAGLAELNQQFADAEVLRQSEKQRKLTESTAKGEAERLAIIRKAQAEQFNVFKLTADAQKKFDEQTWAQRAQTAQFGLNALASLMQTKSREAFELGKAAAIAQALITIPETAIKAYSSLAGIPIVGPVLGAAAAAAAVAAGTTQVNQIRSQRFAYAEGGMIPGVGNKDTVPILATPGETIVPAKNFSDLEEGFSRNAIAGDQIILTRQTNDILNRILEQLTYGIVNDKLTTIISVLQDINISSQNSGGGFDPNIINATIAEDAQNRPQIETHAENFNKISETKGDKRL